MLTKCPSPSRRVILIGQQGPKGDKGDKGETGDQGPKGDKGDPSPADTGKHILDVGQIRGAGLDIDAPTTEMKVPGEVTVNCPVACLLWVSYDVDTRNTQIDHIPPGGWYQHLYHIFVDDVNQAIYNQVSATVPNAAYPVAVNGVIPADAGQHTVSIWVKVTGGHLQQFTSHLQVLAIER